jgi:acid phosphatase type 7
VAAIAATLATLVPGPLLAAQSALKGPYVTALSDSDATVRFELATSAPATVEVLAVSGSGDASTAHPTRVDDHDSSAMHAVRITGLQPATRYAYAVRVGGAVLGEGHFATAPEPTSTAPVTFLLYGDNRTDDVAHAAVVRAMAAVPSDFLVNTGDMVQDGSSAPSWQTFFDIERALLRERPLFTAIGNHELYDDTAGTNFARYFGFPDESGAAHPYGTVRFGSVRLFFLNGEDRWGGGDERAWLERALARADSEPGLVWRFAVLHHGPWSAGPHGPNEALDAAGIPALLAAHKIDLVFSGHDHMYERGDSGVLKYIVSGGGGAPLYQPLHPTAMSRKLESTRHFVAVTVHDDALQLVTERPDGSLVERCGFAKGAPWDCDAPVAAMASVASAASDAASTPVPSAPASAPSSPSSRSTCDLSGHVGGGAQGSGLDGRGVRAGAFASLALLGTWASRRRARRGARPAGRAPGDEG